MRTLKTILLLMLFIGTLFSQDKLTKADSTKLAPLVKHMEGIGLPIDSYFSDSRFEIDRNIGDKFRKSAEEKAKPLERIELDEYKIEVKYANRAKNINSFMEKYKTPLENTEKKYKIPKEITAAILGIESNFGKIELDFKEDEGEYNPFNAYVSLILDEHKVNWATFQLKEWMQASKKFNVNPLEIESSYAGCTSTSQFTPYNLNRFYKGTDLKNILNGIASTSNLLSHYLKKTKGDIRKALLLYNLSGPYADAVLDLAKEAGYNPKSSKDSPFQSLNP